ncbi:type 1 glutamine amidotransferase domain-containing protein [Hirschia litorea]|uniref:Type 1 glutamine amidotransferase domain-containing protein n=1 Tax=Hirschia litorea TaxID=1199156 RepID=A0ABW2IPX8_9PROT
MTQIKDAKIAILATNGFEKSELFEPKRRLMEAGADITIISTDTGSIKSWKDGNWDEDIAVDIKVDSAQVSDFDALVLPGGQMNPDILRTNKKAVSFVRDFFDSGKPLAAICHAPWLLAEADVVVGRKVTSYPSIKTDIINAGGDWEDSQVVVDRGLITSRNPGDIEAFTNKIIEEVQEGRHKRKAA